MPRKAEALPQKGLSWPVMSSNKALMKRMSRDQLGIPCIPFIPADHPSQRPLPLFVAFVLFVLLVAKCPFSPWLVLLRQPPRDMVRPPGILDI